MSDINEKVRFGEKIGEEGGHVADNQGMWGRRWRNGVLTLGLTYVDCLTLTLTWGGISLRFWVCGGLRGVLDLGICWIRSCV